VINLYPISALKSLLPYVEVLSSSGPIKTLIQQFPNVPFNLWMWPNLSWPSKSPVK